MIEEHDKCEICGENLTLITEHDKITKAECYFCKEEKETQIICPNGHYICDECHAKGALDVIADFCGTTDLIDPFEIADEIMKHPNFKVYGPEHHALVPAVVMTSLKNLKCKNQLGEVATNKHVMEAMRRGSKIPGGWCGFYGNCGACVGSGIAMSVFMGATPSKDIPRSIANRTTSRALARNADDLEHCCKRSVKYGICEALTTIKEHFDCKIDFDPKSCRFSPMNDKCEKEKCPFFGRKLQDECV
ncbi:MAG: DUF5714 domain-containing protein [Candidatus Helarchaeota archaeon]